MWSITPPIVLSAAAIVFGASVAQRAVGFGSALIAVPLLAFVIPTKSAVVVGFLQGWGLSVFVATRLRHEIRWPAARRLSIGTVVGAPLGVVVLSRVAGNDLRLLLGVSTCLAAGWVIWQSRISGVGSHPSRRPLWTYSMGLLSGVLNTSLATSGPPLVYELRRMGLVDNEFRATISTVFTTANIVGLPLLLIANLVHLQDVWLVLATTPATILGIVVGTYLGTWLRSTAYLWSVDLLLLATGAVTILEAV